MESKLNQRIPD